MRVKSVASHFCLRTCLSPGPAPAKPPSRSSGPERRTCGWDLALDVHSLRRTARVHGADKGAPPLRLRLSSPSWQAPGSPRPHFHLPPVWAVRSAACPPSPAPLLYSPHPGTLDDGRVVLCWARWRELDCPGISGHGLPPPCCGLMPGAVCRLSPRPGRCSHWPAPPPPDNHHQAPRSSAPPPHLAFAFASHQRPCRATYFGSPPLRGPPRPAAVYPSTHVPLPSPSHPPLLVVSVRHSQRHVAQLAKQPPATPAR
jgi:hypothetical protein